MVSYLPGKCIGFSQMSGTWQPRHGLPGALVPVERRA
jgi:hypothetical protein